MRCGIDTNVLIYFLDSNSPWHTRAVTVFKAAEKGTIDLGASELILVEVLAYGNFSDIDALRTHSIIAELPLRLYSITELELLTAAKLRRDQNVKLADSIHLASAMASHNATFITNDVKLQKKHIPRVQVMSLDKFTRLLA